MKLFNFSIGGDTGCVVMAENEEGAWYKFCGLPGMAVNGVAPAAIDLTLEGWELEELKNGVFSWNK